MVGDKKKKKDNSIIISVGIACVFLALSWLALLNLAS
jgi:hypothetical protein